VFLLNAYDIEPGSYTPRVNTMTDFNLWTWNSRVFPGIDPLVCRGPATGAHPHRQPDHDQPPDPPARPRCSGDRHRRRLGAGAARWPEVTTDMPSGQMRAIEFTPTSPATGRSTATSRTTR
jgi:hypothetical protein